MKLLIGILCLLSSHLLFGQKRIQNIDSLLIANHAKGHFHGNVLIAEGEKVIYNKSFGLANEDTKKKLDENSIFELASVSKQFTAMAVAILKEAGRLSYEDKITKYIPELSKYGHITIRNLIYHTSGLPDYMELLDRTFDKSKIATNEDIIVLLARDTPALLFATDTKWEYSNTGYALLASIIEKASGMSFSDYLSKTIFKPLQMENTLIYRRRYAPSKVDNYAYGVVYSPSDKKYVLPDEVEATKLVVWLDGVVGDGTVNSTVNDLLKWDRALYTNKLLSASGMKEIFEPVKLNDGSSTKYGFGWFVENHPTFGRITSHSGGWAGYKTFIDRHVDKDKTIIILQNRDDVKMPIQEIRNLLYDKPIATKKIRKEVTLTTDQLQKLVGLYEMQKGFEIKVSLDKAQLFAQMTGQNPFALYAEDDHNFFLKVVDAQIRFIKDKDGRLSGLILFQNGKEVEAKRIN